MKYQSIPCSIQGAVMLKCIRSISDLLKSSPVPSPVVTSLIAPVTSHLVSGGERGPRLHTTGYPPQAAPHPWPLGLHPHWEGPRFRIWTTSADTKAGTQPCSLACFCSFAVCSGRATRRPCPCGPSGLTGPRATWESGVRLPPGAATISRLCRAACL